MAEASASLRGARLRDAEWVAASLALDLDARLVDAEARFVTGSILQLFPCRATVVEELTVHVHWVGSAAPAAQLPVTVLPTTFQMPLAVPPAGEQVIEWKVCEGAKVLTSRRVRVSVAKALHERTSLLAGFLDSFTSLETVELRTPWASTRDDPKSRTKGRSRVRAPGPETARGGGSAGCSSSGAPTGEHPARVWSALGPHSDGHAQRDRAPGPAGPSRSIPGSNTWRSRSSRGPIC